MTEKCDHLWFTAAPATLGFDVCVRCEATRPTPPESEQAESERCDHAWEANGPDAKTCTECGVRQFENDEAFLASLEELAGDEERSEAIRQANLDAAERGIL